MSNGNPSIPERLHVPLLLSVAVLGADLLQYTFSALSWGTFELLMEREFQKEGRDEKNEHFGAPSSVNWLGNVFLSVKVTLLVVAYIWLLTALYSWLFF